MEVRSKIQRHYDANNIYTIDENITVTTLKKFSKEHILNKCNTFLFHSENFAAKAAIGQRLHLGTTTL